MAMEQSSGTSSTKSVGNIIKLADDEADDQGRPLEDYCVAIVKKPSRGEVHVILTKMRVLLYLWTQKTIIVEGVNISDVLGTNIYWSSRSRPLLGSILIGIGLSFIASIIFQPLLATSIIAGILVIASILIIAGIYYIINKRSYFAMIINIRAATGAIRFSSAPENVLEKGLGPGKWELEAEPGPGVVSMARDLGGMILNIQHSKVTE
jgi:hypothetical protein